jgi:hypothetical protein
MQSLPEFNSLAFREMFLVWAIRIGCAQNVEHEVADDALEQAFHLAKVGHALRPFRPFAETVVNAWRAAGRAPHIHCICSTVIGEDEWRLVQLIAALQDRDLIRASGCVSDVLPRASVRLLIDRALRVAAEFGNSGWHFVPRSAALARRAALH